MRDLQSIKKALGKVGDLPSMPEVVAEVLHMTDDPDVSISEVSDTIQKDPGLTAKLLKVSNSPYYGMKQVVGTLKLALVILGVREVRNIVLGISVVDTLRDRNTERLLEQHDFWSHSVLVAGFSKKLGTHFRLGLQGEDFIGGLLHDIGKMVLWRQLKDEYEAVFKQSGGHSDSLCSKEFEKFDFDHADAAAVLAVNWNLPQTLSDALWYHHPREDRNIRDAKDPRFAALVRIANFAAREDWENEDPSAMRSCSDDDAWEALTEGYPPSLDERRELLLGYWNELKESPAPVL